MIADSGFSSYNLSLVKGFITLHDRSPLSKSAFCQLRGKISYRFFKAAFERLTSLFQYQLRTWKGLEVVAIDGKHITLPRTSDLVKHRFTGRKTSQYSESYMPKGFLTVSFNVLNGFICRHTFNPILNEIADAIQMIPNFVSNTLFLYDRLYFCEKIFKAHKNHKSYFVARLKRNANKKVMSFFSSKKTFSSYEHEGVKLYLIKIKSPKGTSVYVTNLAHDMFTRKEICDLYKLRWQIETCFYDLSCTCYLEKWHSKSYNGILQELYMRMWIFNATRLITGVCQKYSSVGQVKYKKANFRLLLSFVKDNLHRFWTDFSKLIPRVKEIVRFSSETRITNKRQNPRVIKSPRSPYKYCSTEWQWDKKWVLT